MPLSVEYADLSLAQQVLERQGSVHVANMRPFLKQWGNFSEGGEPDGFLLQAFHPINQQIVDAGNYVLGLLQDIHQGAADHMEQTLNAYIDADQRIHNALSKASQMAGGSPLPYHAPTLPTLETATYGASSFYRGEDETIGESIAGGILEAGLYTGQLAWRLGERSAKALSTNRSISESQDASSYLKEPEKPKADMSDIRWSAGMILGSVDWLIEKVTGTSFINDVIAKYVGGDWRIIHCAQTAWSEIGDALIAVGQNDSEILPALSEWTGKGSEAANAFITALAGGTTLLESAASLVSTIMGVLASIVRTVAGLILSILGLIERKCIHALAAAAVPVGGWVAAGLEMASLAADLFPWIRRVYKLYGSILSSIENSARAIGQLNEIRFTLANLAEAAARGIAARA
ncbi:hypothetical protein [uncultured Actinomyces sp.]|uniref:hypothetical protein n=1 Tax=uncultured Actinomyces sp. TaxID=249061 RepID=UPI0028EFE92A|nr:hypothetical protein [uncultured Actinomyces sp.]